MEGSRQDYDFEALEEERLDPDPLRQFERWFDEAVRMGVELPDAMVLATVSPEGRPSARVVCLRGLDRRGFVFYTDYASPKARDLEAAPRAAIVFFWAPLGRQVRASGVALRVSRGETEAYFETRPRGSQLAAWASEQSRPLESRSEIEDRYARIEARYAGEEVPAPPNWGGIRVAPDSVEFWQGRPNRLHDRFLYLKEGGDWSLRRLSP